MLDEVMIKGMHVEFLRRRDLHAEHEPHVLFQASTIGALLDGAYEGDATFAELAQHGDLGLGTINGLDGEMIALDGRFFRADLDGAIHEIEASARTPFAVVDWFEPTVEFELGCATGHEGLLAEGERHAPEGAVVLALRVDGAFDLVKARSVPKQEPPVPPPRRCRGRPARLRAHGRGGLPRRVSFPRLQPGDRNHRLSPALHHCRP